VWSALVEAEPSVERARRGHPAKRVELELAIADRVRLVEELARKPLAPAFAASRRLHIQALDLAGLRRLHGRRTAAAPRCQRTQRDAAEDRVGCRREQQAAVRRRIRAGQRGELALEILETEIDLDRPRILDEEHPG